ncbi:MAG: S9 family peptidase [Prevotellaceae bacterium]|nr:S9 family peptidase [Prevotellaceae bacterium]
MKKKIKLLLIMGTAMMTANAAAQKLLTLEDVLYSGSNYYNLAPETVYTTWWGNIPVKTTPDETLNLTSGEKIVSVEELNDVAGEKVARSGHYIDFPYEGETVAQVASGRKMALIDWTKKTVVWSAELPEKAANRDFSPESKAVAYTIEGNLYVLTADGQTHQISTDGSTDGSEDVVYGTSVHRDEFGIKKGTFWSPDGKRLAFYRMDQSMVPNYPQVDITQRIAATYANHYPMAGETSHQVTVGIYDTETDGTVWLKLLGEKEDYHTNLSWAPDGNTLYIQELNRDQNDMRLAAYDTRTGECRGTILEETDEKYVEPLNPLLFLPWDSSKAVYQSQRDGFNHIYLLDLGSTPAKLTQLTSGEWVVQKVAGFNKKAKTIIYLSNEADPRTSCLYSVSLKGKRTLISTGEGVHSATLSADGTTAIDRWSSPTVPRNVNLVSTSDGKAENVLTATDKWAEQGYSLPEVTSGSIKAADGVTDLYYRMVKPIDFDPTKRYPTIVYVYGGPHAHNIEASWHWGMRGWEAYMATKGYLLFVLDNRGSEWRGRDFEQTTFRHLGDNEMKDQMQGVEYLKSLPYVDASRMGVQGWSFGGFMTTNLMCTYPDVFKVGVAGGPVIDWKYYEVMYGERYMDTPQQNPDGFASSSLIPKAANLRGRLQIILGYNDDTVVPQHTLSFVRACIDAGTQPDLFLYPGGKHNMYGRDQVHLYERITRYFEDYLK